MKLPQPHPRGTSADILESVAEILKEAERQQASMTDAYQDEDEGPGPLYWVSWIVIAWIVIGLLVWRPWE